MAPRSLRFRHRMAALVVLAAAGLATLTVVTLVLGRRSESELAGIETRYVPLIEVDRDLKQLFVQTSRALEDAASAADESRLVEADKLVGQFVDRLHAGRDTIADNGADPATLEADFRTFFTTTRVVAAAMVAGSPTDKLEANIEVMRRARRTFSAHLDKATTPDRHALAAAFAAARDSQRDALRIEIVVAIAALTAMALLSWRITRRTVKALHEVASGVERLASGELEQEIEVATPDELGDLAREANRTAARLREYRGRTQRQADELAAAHVMEQQRAEAALANVRELRRAKDAADTASRELEAFSYSVAHDLRAPLRAIHGFSAALVEELGATLTGDAQQYLERISAGAITMGQLIDALLGLARVSRTERAHHRVDLSKLAHEVAAQLQASAPERVVEWVIAEGLVVHGDPQLLRVLLENLLGNAWKFAAKRARARIELAADADGLVVRDNGAGFDMAYAEKLFVPFQRLHTEREFTGTGIGLATVQRIVQRHGGRIWADGAVDRGAAFHFTLAPAG